MRKTALQKAKEEIQDLCTLLAYSRDQLMAERDATRNRVTELENLVAADQKHIARLCDAFVRAERRAEVVELQLKQAFQDRDAALQARDAERKKVAGLECALNDCADSRNKWIREASAAERRAADASKAFDRLVQALMRKETNAN
jgi:hypothetical protein